MELIREFFSLDKKYDCWIDVEYFINEEKKVVVCKLNPGASRFNPKYDSETHSKSNISRLFYKECAAVQRTFVGKSKCIEPDVFDPEVGKKIAYDRAMIKLIVAQDKYYDEFRDFLLEDVNWVNEIRKDAVDHGVNISNRLQDKLKKFM